VTILSSTQVVRAPMSDGSVGYNVEMNTGDNLLTFACESAAHARALSLELGKVAWTDSVPLADGELANR